MDRYFFSYAHQDWGRSAQLLEDFYKSLKDRVEGLAGPRISGFRDHEAISVGKAWTQTIGNALQNSSVFVAVISESWLESLVCQKELSIFKGKCGGDLTGRVIPLLWEECDIPGNHPISSQGLQYCPPTKGDTMRWLHKQGRSDVYIEEIAREIKRCHRSFLPPQPDGIYDIKRVDSPNWYSSYRESSVSIAFVAPKKDEILHICPDRSCCYDDSGSHCWRPFAEHEETISEIVFRIVDKKGYRYSTLAESNLAQDLKGWSGDKIALVLADLWGARSSWANPILQNCKTGSVTIGIVIVFDKREPDEVTTPLRNWFWVDSRTKAINSLQSLEDAITSLLDFLRAQIINSSDLPSIPGARALPSAS